MPLTVAEVLTRAGDLIQDQTNVRWPQAELLRWLNDARREIAIARPDLYATISVISLVAGTKQGIPADGARFLDAIRNMDSGGTTPLAAVRPVQREILDAQNPAWHTEASGVTKHFMFDDRVPRSFYVYPAAAAAAKLEIAYSQTPTDITVTSTQLTQEDIYTGALVDYVCYRAFSKDATYAGNIQRAAAAYMQFKNSITEGDARDLTASPNVGRIDGVPPRSGG
jgi:hypothetical protein